MTVELEAGATPDCDVAACPHHNSIDDERAFNLFGAASQFARGLSIELQANVQTAARTGFVKCTGAHASPAKETGRVRRVECPGHYD